MFFGGLLNSSSKFTKYITSYEFLAWLIGKLALLLTAYLAANTFELFSKNQEFLTQGDIPNIPQEEEQNTKGKSFDAYAVIMSRNIFGFTEAPTEEKPTTQVKKSDLNLRLVGTNLTKGQSPFAIIENKSKSEQDVFGNDEMVFGSAKLLEIQQEFVKIEVDGEIQKLEIEEGNSSPSLSNDSGVETLNEEGTKFVVSETELNKQLENLPKLLSQARAVPYFRNGKSIGMRLFALQRDSMYAKLGLKNGDILTGINDHSLDNPADALKLFEQLRNERSIQVAVERAGTDLTLDYSIE